MQHTFHTLPPPFSLLFSASSGHCTVVGAFKHVTTWLMGFFLFVCIAIACEPDAPRCLCKLLTGLRRSAFECPRCPDAPRCLCKLLTGLRRPAFECPRCVLRGLRARIPMCFHFAHKYLLAPFVDKTKEKRTGIHGNMGM